MIPDEDVARFVALFSGRKDAYGTGRGEAIRARPGSVQYGDHLAGVGSGLGIYPMLPDNTCRFAAVDLDEPDFVFIRGLQVYLPGPTWIERSRSGNAHLWVFFYGGTPAWAARGVLRAALEAAGRPNVEVFPKQDGLREGMLGNYINLPWHGDERPILDPDDAHLRPWRRSEWLPQALKHRHEAAPWVRRATALGVLPPEKRPEAAPFGEQVNLHVCAHWIYDGRHTRPIQPGARHDVLFALSKQLLNWRSITHATARRMVHEVNEASVQPVDYDEVNRIFNSVVAGRYTSTGCDNPLLAPYVHPDCPIAHGRC